MRVLVCGGRDFTDAITIAHAIFDVDVTAIICGGAKGADACAEDIARANGIPLEVFPADWKAHGKAAGPIRNSQMLKEGKPDLVLAFPGGRGTADMVRKADAAGVPVRKIKPWPAD